MKPGNLVIAILFALLPLSACSAFAHAPTQTPTPTQTATIPPTATPSPTPTAAPTQTPLPTATLTLAPTNTPTPEISSTPITVWRGVPIIPGAYSIDQDGGGLSFQVNLSVDEINAYYKTQLPKAGWDLFAQGSTETGNVFDIYSNGDQLLTLAIAEVPGSIDTLVILIII